MFSNSYINKQITVFLTIALVIPMFVFTSSVNTADANTTQYSKNNDPIYITSLRLQLLQLQLQLATLLKIQAEQNKYNPPVKNRREYNPYFVQVTTMAPFAVGRNTAELQSEVDKGSSEFAKVYFEYGIGSHLNDESEKTKIANAYSYQNVYKIRITDLDPDTLYSYRAVTEDEDGNTIYGQVRTFTTVKQASETSFAGRPVIESEGITNITSNGAEIKSFVSMNDYDKGNVFVIYAKDRSFLDDVEDYDSFDEIPVASYGKDGLSKQIIVRDVSERTTVSARIYYGLAKATKYYYSSCVEYVYRGNSKTITCSDTESFITAN